MKTFFTLALFFISLTSFGATIYLDAGESYDTGYEKIVCNSGNSSGNILGQDSVRSFCVCNWDCNENNGVSYPSGPRLCFKSIDRNGRITQTVLEILYNKTTAHCEELKEVHPGCQ